MSTTDERLYERQTYYFDHFNLPEDIAWQKAYQDLEDEGILQNLFHFGYKEGKIRYRYIFAHSTTDNQDYTYLCARDFSSPRTIYISNYSNLKEEVYRKIATIANEELRKDMHDGLEDLYATIQRDYVIQFVDELNFKIKDGQLDDTVDCRINCLKGLVNLFHELNVSGIAADFDESANDFAATIKCNNVHKLVYVVDKLKNFATLHINPIF